MEWVGSLLVSVLKWLVEFVVQCVIELVLALIAWIFGRIRFLFSRAWHLIFDRRAGGDLP